MKGSATLYAAIQLLMVALIANVNQVQALTPEQTCPLVANNTYIADPRDCAGWVLCRNGKAFYGQCNENLYYDATSGVCDFPQNVNCNNNVADMCAGLTDVYKADANDCSKYCYCDDGVAYCQKCPSGQHYDPNSVSCVWATSSNCEANSPCRLVQNGFMAGTKSCRSWIRCGSSQIVSQGECSAIYYFNPNNGKCDYPQNVKCSVGPPGPVGPPSQIDPTPPANLCKGGQSFYSDDISCPGYFWCRSVDSVAQYGKCPKNSFFNPTLQQCVDTDTVACNYNRCDGVTKPFMTKPKTGCKQYLNCKDGVAYDEGKCPADNPYFNEIAGVCQPKKPNYPVCSS